MKHEKEVLTLGTLWPVVMRKGSLLATTLPSSLAQVSPLQQDTAPSTAIPSQEARYWCLHGGNERFEDFSRLT